MIQGDARVTIYSYFSSMMIRQNINWEIFGFHFSEYRTVSGVAGPLVILDKVKVGSTLLY